MLRSVVVSAVVPAVVVSLAGCSSSQPVPSSDPVVVVAGSHANAPAPSLTPTAMKALEPAIAANRFAGVILADSTPSLAGLTLVEVRGTPAGRENLIRTNEDRIRTAMTTPPDTNGADTFEAITMAAGQIRTTSRTGTIIVAASGLDDAGVMAMTQPHLLDAAPTDLVTARRQTLAGTDLRGITVILTGLGQTTPPQARLDAQRRAQLTGLWTAVLKTTGAKTLIDPALMTGAPVKTTRTVTPIPISTTQAAVRIAPCTTTGLVFDQTSAVRFRPDSTTFIDESAARTALARVTDWLIAKPSRTAALVGTTADDGSAQSGQKTLSRARAQAVADLLTTAGVAASQLSVTGVGSRFPQYTPDRTTTGVLDPARAVMNRSVRLTLTETC